MLRGHCFPQFIMGTDLTSGDKVLDPVAPAVLYFQTLTCDDTSSCESLIKWFNWKYVLKLPNFPLDFFLGWLVGERPSASALPSVVTLWLLPEAFGWRPAPPSGHFRREALCHRGTGWPRHQLLHPGLCTLSNACQHQVTHQSQSLEEKHVVVLPLILFSLLYSNTARFG